MLAGVRRAREREKERVVRALSGRELGRAEGVAGPLKVDWAGRGKEERESGLGSGERNGPSKEGELGRGFGERAGKLGIAMGSLFYFDSKTNTHVGIQMRI